MKNHQFDWERLLNPSQEAYRLECLIKLRWNDKITCPHCKSSKKIYTGKDKRFRCSECDKRFTATSGTVLHSTKLPLLKWFTALKEHSIHKTGMSSKLLAESLGISIPTAFYLSRRLRMGMANSKRFKGKLSGEVVEFDETYVGGKNWNRHADKKVKNSQGRSAKDKSPVFGMLSRDEGKIFIWVMKRNKSGEEKNVSIGPGIRALIRSKVDRNSVIATDEYRAYNGLDRDFIHLRVNHCQKNFVNGEASTNCLEGFWSRLKKALMGTYCGRVHHLNLIDYCREIAFKFVTRMLDKYERAEEILGDCLMGRYRKRGLYLL